MARRGHGEGTISKRKDGRWWARLDLGWRDGRRVRKPFYGRTRREVQEKLDQARQQQRSGILPTGPNQTVGQFLTHWLQHSVRPTVRPSTHASYADNVRLHIDPTLGRVRLQNLTPQHIQAMLNAKLEAGLSPRTVQYVHAILRRALGQALKWGLVPVNVARLVDPPRVRQHEIQPLSPDQAKQLIQALSGHRFEALYTITLATGLRRGEVLGLRWGDVDLDAGTVTVRAALQRIDGILQLVEPKTERSRRTVDLAGFAEAALRAHRVRQLEERLSAGSGWRETDLVFCTTIGTALDGRNVSRHFERILAAADLPRIRFHDLRHTCASLMLAQGEHARTIMEVLGHSQISLTMNTYAHVMPAVKKDAAKRLDALLAQ